MTTIMRKPKWLRSRLSHTTNNQAVKKLIKDNGLHTVCESAQCPNLHECWSRGTATVMILGDVCTRSCTFCAVKTGRPSHNDLEEPLKVAQAVKKMNLKHCVITSVARDDLKDGGANIWAQTINEVRRVNPNTKIEVLTPDFRGNQDQIDIVLSAKPDIFNHNLETVERLQQPIRKTANWDHSLSILSYATSKGFTTKSGIMLGIGEEQDEIKGAINALREHGISILTIGQYLQPNKLLEPVSRWVHPDEFVSWKEYGLSIGIKVVESGALVRSSYHADEQTNQLS